jgi:hypothetical protein
LRVCLLRQVPQPLCGEIGDDVGLSVGQGRHRITPDGFYRGKRVIEKPAEVETEE